MGYGDYERNAKLKGPQPRFNVSTASDERNIHRAGRPAVIQVILRSVLPVGLHHGHPGEPLNSFCSFSGPCLPIGRLFSSATRTLAAVERLRASGVFRQYLATVRLRVEAVLMWVFQPHTKHAMEDRGFVNTAITVSAPSPSAACLHLLSSLVESVCHARKERTAL